MRLTRLRTSRTLISIVSMIDVLMILLVFFMVTSTYLDLRMIPMAERANDAAAEPAPAPATGPASILVTISPDGGLRLRGREVTYEFLARLLADRLKRDPSLSVVVLPSGQASAQSLVDAMDVATQAGVTRLRVLRPEPEQ